MHCLVCSFRFAVGVFTAIRADHLFVLVGHLLEESGKSLATILAQPINRFIAGTRIRHYSTSPFGFEQLVEPFLEGQT
jgi:hypothetical protein